MRISRAVLLSALLLLGGAFATAGPVHASTSGSVSVSFFYDSLAPYGEWTASARFGDVWHPTRVSAGWRPYEVGRWAYTDLGWTFVSTEPWGWAAYHYGRWYLDPVEGWVWVPGTEWAPAWVVFYEGGDWVGWAPLPPGLSLDVRFGSRPIADPAAFCFVSQRHFLEPQLRAHVASVSRNRALLRTTANVTRFSHRRGTVVAGGLSAERIARATGRRVTRTTIVPVTRASASGLRRDHVAVFRPSVSRKATHPPKRLRTTRPAPTDRPVTARRQQARPIPPRSPRAAQVRPPVRRAVPHTTRTRAPVRRVVPHTTQARAPVRRVAPRSQATRPAKRQASRPPVTRQKAHTIGSRHPEPQRPGSARLTHRPPVKSGAASAGSPAKKAKRHGHKPPAGNG